MKPTDFAERNTIFATDQPEYRPLVAYRGGDGRVVICWTLSWRERLTFLLTGRLWHQVLTFKSPLQPQLLTASKPELPAADDGLAEAAGA